MITIPGGGDVTFDEHTALETVIKKAYVSLVTSCFLKTYIEFIFGCRCVLIFFKAKINSEILVRRGSAYP